VSINLKGCDMDERGEASAPSHGDSIRPSGRLNAISVCCQQIGRNGPFAFIQMLVLVYD